MTAFGGTDKLNGTEKLTCQYPIISYQAVDQTDLTCQDQIYRYYLDQECTKTLDKSAKLDIGHYNLAFGYEYVETFINAAQSNNTRIKQQYQRIE